MDFSDLVDFQMIRFLTLSLTIGYVAFFDR